MAERIKPTEAAKRLEIRPQIIYGLIKRGKIKTFDNPNGSVALVDYDDVKITVSRMGHRGPRKERAHKGKNLPKGIKRGSIISQDRAPIKGAFSRPSGGDKSVRAVTDGTMNLVWLSDGTVETIYGTETLAEKLQKGTAKIEKPHSLLGVLMYHWEHNEQVELAESLRKWTVENEVGYLPIDTPHDLMAEDENEQPLELPKVIEVELGPEGIDLSNYQL